ncbi:MAG TPA: TonB-dependent receptor [Dongiaceae bacterium]|nr:TonB-dependent receptor [Dongiaceae bacterium]
MRSRALLGWFVVLLFVVGISAPASSAQAVYGSVLGTVTDQQGAAVAGAKVVVTSASKGTAEETTSNADGNYSVSHLIPDTYNIHIEATGFKSYDVKGVQVSADTGVKVDAKLDVGAITQSVEVTGEIPQLKTDRSDVSITFNEKYVSDLPILNRNFTNFELLSPGTQKLVGWSHAATENPQGGQQIFVNGQHFSGTAFELDGTDNQDPILGIIVVNPNLDAIQESKIALQNYDAEFGKAVAGVVTVQTKSGSNQFHGGAFYDWRGDGQQARDPFKNAPGVPLPNASFKQFGGNLGGPVVKDRLFFFGDYQGTRQTGGITNQMTIPTALVQESCNPATNASSPTPGFCNLSEYLGNPLIKSTGQVYNPATGNPLDGSGRTAFAGNLIPINLISGPAAAILADFPTPTNDSVINNYVASGSGPYNQNSFDTRVDYNAPRGFTVFGRFSLDYFSLSGKGTLGVLGGVGFGPGGLNGTSNVHNYSLATGFDKAIGTKWLTDLRFGWFRYNPQTAYIDGSSTPMTAFGISGLNRGTPDTGGLSSFFFNGNGMNQGNNNGAFGDGLNVGRCNCPLTEKEDQFQVVNNWTRIQGNHQIKFGADIRYAKNLRVPSDANRTGILNFNSGGTSNAGDGGLDLATFLLGDVTSFNRFVSNSLDAAERQKRWFFYGQDTWRVTTKLTFNYGLRWEIYFPETVNGKANGGFANIDQGIIRVAGVGGNSLNGNTDNTLKAFAPRLGIAYQVDNKTVVRLGYGRSFDIGVFGSNFGHVVTQNLPVLANQDVSDSSLNSGATNDRSAVFTFASGAPPIPDLAGIIPSNGILPLRGPDNNVDPRVRPRVQRLPTLDAWNVTLQRQITPTMNVEVAYIGNKGTHTFAGNGPAYNANEAAVGPGTDPYKCSLITDATSPDFGQYNCSPSGFAGAVPTNFRRRFFLNGVPTFTYGAPYNYVCCSSDIGNYFGNDASTHYNALQVKVEKRFNQGLQFLAHYTYAHAYNYDSSYFSVDPRYSYGPDDFNRNHVFVLSTVYELPVGRGKKYLSDLGRAANFVLGGWQISNTTNWSGGLPFTPSIGECGQISDAGPCRPDLLPGKSFHTGLTHSGGNLYWFTPVSSLSQGVIAPTNALDGVDTCGLPRTTSGPWALPACGHIGNAGRNSLRGPHAFFSDLSLAKNFNFTEKVKAQFRFDAYNVFNHPVLGFSSTQGNTCIDCGGGGQITAIEADASPNAPNGMRQLQFGLRFTF